MNVFLTIPSLSGGGAERVLVSLAHVLVQRGHGVQVITLSSGTSDFYRLPVPVLRHGLGHDGRSAGVFPAALRVGRAVGQIRRILKEHRPDVVISFMDDMNVITLLAAAGTRIPAVITEHCDPRFNLDTSPLVSGARRLLYPTASVLVSVSKGVDACFPFVPATKRRVIYNPLPLPDEERSSDRIPAECLQPRRRRIVAMGRLTRQKGFDLLIGAFAVVAGSRPDWDLVILGEGDQRDALTEMVEQLDLRSRVHLPGIVRSPERVLAKAEIFVLSSRYEGFGNALIESMSVGLPVISFDCPSGPAEIVSHGHDGLLVPPEDVKALCEAMAKLMDDDELRLRLGRAAYESSKRFTPDRFADEWERELAEVIAASRSGGRA